MTRNHANVKSLVLYNTPTTEDLEAANFDKQGFVDLDFLQTNVPSKDSHFYFCGPIPFLEAVNRALNEWGVAKERIHFEAFNPIAILGGQNN